MAEYARIKKSKTWYSKASSSPSAFILTSSSFCSSLSRDLWIHFREQNDPFSPSKLTEGCRDERGHIRTGNLLGMIPSEGWGTIARCRNSYCIAPMISLNNTEDEMTGHSVWLSVLVTMAGTAAATRITSLEVLHRYRLEQCHHFFFALCLLLAFDSVNLLDEVLPTSTVLFFIFL